MADAVCAKCGHANPLGSNFCSSCGAALAGGHEEPTTITYQDDAAGETGDAVTPTLTDLPSGVGALVVTRGPNTGGRYLLDQAVTTAGRHPDSEIFLDDITVSRRHAEIERSDASYVVRDVGSLNGTYLNRERIEDEATLSSGDEVQIGTFRLVFVTGEGG